MIETVNRGVRNFRPVRAIICTQKKHGFRVLVRPGAEVWNEADAPDVQWWQLEGLGWKGIHVAARLAGMRWAQEVTELHCHAWEFVGDAEDEWENSAVLISEATALMLIDRLHKPPMSVSNHKTPYRRKELPPGREGAARKLARTMLPASMTDDVMLDIYRMFVQMDECADKDKHLHFWTWALHHRKVAVPSVRLGIEPTQEQEMGYPLIGPDHPWYGNVTKCQAVRHEAVDGCPNPYCGMYVK